MDCLAGFLAGQAGACTTCLVGLSQASYRLRVTLVLTPIETTGVGVVFQGSQGVVDTIAGRSGEDCIVGRAWFVR